MDSQKHAARDTAGDDEYVAADRRVDGPVEVIDEAVVLAAVDGVGPAMDHMVESGVERTTALRVMAGPEYHRVPKRETLARVLDYLALCRRIRKHGSIT